MDHDQTKTALKIISMNPRNAEINAQTMHSSVRMDVQEIQIVLQTADQKKITAFIIVHATMDANILKILIVTHLFLTNVWPFGAMKQEHVKLIEHQILIRGPWLKLSSKIFEVALAWFSEAWFSGNPAKIENFMEKIKNRAWQRNFEATAWFYHEISWGY